MGMDFQVATAVTVAHCTLLVLCLAFLWPRRCPKRNLFVNGTIYAIPSTLLYSTVACWVCVWYESDVWIVAQVLPSLNIVAAIIAVCCTRKAGHDGQLQSPKADKARIDSGAIV
jgi:hypothetical protein